MEQSQSNTPNGQNRRSAAERYSQQPVPEQIRRWEQRCEVIHSLVKEQLETISESGDVFDQQDLYPAIPLLIAHTWTTLLGFTPERMVESNVVTEALFERLPSSLASGFRQAEEFAGSRS